MPEVCILDCCLCNQEEENLQGEEAVHKEVWKGLINDGVVFKVMLRLPSRPCASPQSYSSSAPSKTLSLSPQVSPTTVFLKAGEQKAVEVKPGLSLSHVLSCLLASYLQLRLHDPLLLSELCTTRG